MTYLATHPAAVLAATGGDSAEMRVYAASMTRLRMTTAVRATRRSTAMTR